MIAGCAVPHQREQVMYFEQGQPQNCRIAAFTCEASLSRTGSFTTLPPVQGGLRMSEG